jgi:hypothetical protein
MMESVKAKRTRRGDWLPANAIARTTWTGQSKSKFFFSNSYQCHNPLINFLLDSSCDRCRNGFWDMRGEDPDGCRTCSCNLIGTFGNEGCDKVTGQCTCKPMVVGEQCDQCAHEHYGLSQDDPSGCKPWLVSSESCIPLFYSIENSG